jgi:Icc-related predicted phosphoesterase
MKILHISDTHSFHGLFPMNRFEGIDIVIHSGDCSNYKDPYRNEQEVRDFIAWYSTIPVPVKIYVAGNHDTSIEKRLITRADFMDNGIIYLENEGMHVGNTYFYGSPHTPSFNEWAFMKARHKLYKVWDAIPEDTDVLITHGPPKGILDLSEDRYHNLEMCGCSALRKRVEKMNLKAVCFGHIHDSDGISNQGMARIGGKDTIYSNAACVFDGRFDKGLTSYGNIFTIEDN